MSPRNSGFGGYALTTEQKKVCDITIQTTEGPYYITNTPQLADNSTINSDGLTGKFVTLSGVVQSSDDPGVVLSGAKIEIRQADDDGVYHPQSNGDYTSYDSKNIKLRGHVLTNSKGEYRIQTIYPGLYEGRARHIHFRVSHAQYNPVITQLIMPYEGDIPTIQQDNIAQSLPDCQIISGSISENSSNLRFDFKLKKE